MSDTLVYNTLIQNAYVVDGSGAPAFQGDIAILGERISVHPPHSQLQAHSVINATGLYLAPGFIDVHTHDDLQVIKSPQMCAKISQGVTTVIVFN